MAKDSKSNDPELEISAKWSGPEFWKDWSKGKKGKSKHMDNSGGMGGALYFVGFLGALVYYMQAANGFGEVITGFLHALIWPAYVVYQLLEGFYGAVN